MDGVFRVVLFLRIRRPRTPTLFPYTTLFRSRPGCAAASARRPALCSGRRGTASLRARAARSEEHTSELQSRGHLVCRLLLEKEKHDSLPAHRQRGDSLAVRHGGTLSPQLPPH